MSRLGLAPRLSLVFAVLLLASSGAWTVLQMRSTARLEQEVVQRLSSGLAAHIADNAELMAPQGLDPAAVHALFDKLMDVNPSVEVYLLDLDGRVLAQAAPPGQMKRWRVDLAPVRELLGGASLPILGDDPRHASARKVFSAAPFRHDGRSAGYVYVILFGEDHDAVAQRVAGQSALRHSLWAMALVVACGLLAGVAAFYWITRPLRALTADVDRFEAQGPASGVLQGPAPPAATAATAAEGDEIAALRRAFASMAARIAAQWRELTAQDQQRRELVANISHDLRTPLTSLHGYLETLRLKAATLSEPERRRYLDIALGQSLKVGRLAQQLFELARLEHGAIQPEKEHFSLADVVQDVFQKFELAAQARQQQLVADIDAGLPQVHADLGMIERVLTNLLDNAIRHTPAGGRIEVRLRRHGGGVEVLVVDDGPGIPPELQAGLFTRPAFQQRGRESMGGLGLVIVHRILQLHGAQIRLMTDRARGAGFAFRLGDAPAGPVA